MSWDLILFEEKKYKIIKVFQKVLILKRKSPPKPVGEIIVHFESLNDDLDLEGLVADIDIEKQKTLLSMKKWPEEIERSKILFLTKK